MRVKTYFIAPLITVQDFAPNNGMDWRGMPLDDADPAGLQLICCDFRGNEEAEGRWAGTEGVQPLPHPFNKDKPISADHHKVLQKKIGTAPSDTVFDVATKAGAICKDFKLTPF